ncbi:similar to Saccharomyces cerevisiae YHR076W PTC7 Type 2C protein phosphatase (PP2C) [Maudiozyma saulgeensis]|uniref:Protein phosphatase n=1 Tax=Maudiozyma saulgeensis TaxID=1789683 RepID=A0A1X7QYH7_9SACH|nr:similar to Saccharomyces cerevisiae YHR076W PTC7 Type 2C protein phosphatase (PP2C) [Kazachstania saulgeensis]
MFASPGLRSFRLPNRSFYYFSHSSKIIGGNYSLFSKRLFFSGSQNNFNNQYGSNGQQYDPSSASTNQFTYKSVVAYQPKDRDDVIYQKLKDSIMSPTGEDNFFIQANSVSDLYAGVADGVGGWAEHGYDSSAISRELCKTMAEISSTLNPTKIQLTPKEIIDEAYKKIKNDKVVQVGGTTAVATHFDANGTLTVANLGDSWCGVFRNEKLTYQTKFQTVGFNAPYQLAIIPNAMLKEAAARGGSYIQNIPSDADEYSFQLQKDDVVIIATDGVTDNIATDDMEIFLKDKKVETNTNLQQVANAFVKDVVKLSKDPNFPSVFAQEISKLYGKEYRGGKEDDITVVMVKVE